MYYYRQRGILQEHTVPVFLEHMGLDTHFIWSNIYIYIFNLEGLILNLGAMVRGFIELFKSLEYFSSYINYAIQQA